MTVNELLKTLTTIMYRDDTEISTDAERESSQEDADSSVGVFMPPLQAELELFKKSTGVDNVYDEEQQHSEEQHCDYENEEDELDSIKRMAGLEPRVIVTTPTQTEM